MIKRENNEEYSLRVIKYVLKKNFNKDLKIEKDLSAHYDLYNNDLNARVEVKWRYSPIEQCIKYLEDDQGFMIEKTKYDYLSHYNSIYVNYFKYDEIQLILMWDVEKIKPEWKQISCQKSQENKNFINKEADYLKAKDSCVVMVAKNDNNFKKVSLKILKKLLSEKMLTICQTKN